MSFWAWVAVGILGLVLLGFVVLFWLEYDHYTDEWRSRLDEEADRTARRTGTDSRLWG